MVKGSKILDCGTAFYAEINSSVSAVENEMAVDVVVEISNNVRGVVKFLRNSFSSGFPNRFSVRHRKAPPLSRTASHVSSNGATAKSRSQLKQSMEKDDTDQQFPAAFKDLEAMKHCEYCSFPPWEKPKEKFSYCAVCRLICYCSKKCQQAHWKDHKLFCKSPKTRSSR